MKIVKCDHAQGHDAWVIPTSQKEAVNDLRRVKNYVVTYTTASSGIPARTSTVQWSLPGRRT